MEATFAAHVPAFLDDMARAARLRPHTLRAYRYELTAAAVALTTPLDQLTLVELEHWAGRGAVSLSTVARRTATLSRFFTWAICHQLCTVHPWPCASPPDSASGSPALSKAVPTALPLEKAIALSLSPTSSSSPCCVSRR
ncbi:MAG: site-specific integrase [Chloroflexales bacterium]|nr:site-specific integrase [Chloroflexales bacterium]